MAINFFEIYGINRVISLSVVGHGFNYIDEVNGGCVIFILNKKDL
jgi:hypothetical protein